MESRLFDRELAIERREQALTRNQSMNVDKYLTVSPTHTFFYAGPLSQWWYSPFYYAGRRFNCAEQFMMAMKAKLFQDDAAFDMIMAVDAPFAGDQRAWNAVPREQQRLGREVRNFDYSVWDDACRTIVLTANVLKFTQNIDLHEILRATVGDLVEASPVDKIWGIGLARDNPLIFDPNNWRGRNYLGQVLTKTRELTTDLM